MSTTGPQPGTVLGGRYRLERLLGAGGMGVVYEATQLSLGRRVAVKVIRADHAASADVARRFQNEMSVVARLQHPHVVHVIDGGADDDGTLFLAMELLGGDTLRARVSSRGLLPVDEALRIVEEIASALVETHRADVLHRDLKAENVMLVPTAGQPDSVKVLDFGIARLGAPAVDGGLTPAGAVTGTPGYIAPEQLLGQPVDGRADLYALGVIAFEMLAGEPPFSGSLMELLMRHMSTPARRVADVARTRRVEVPRAVDDLVAALLEKDPAHRPSSAAHVVAAVRNLRGAAALTVGDGVPLPAALQAAHAASTPPPSSASGSLPPSTSASTSLALRHLVGRTAELHTICAALDDATAGRGTVVFLVGEPGIGKTRLSDAAAEAAVSRGFVVAWGRAWEAGGAPAFHPWAEAIETLLEGGVGTVPPEDLSWLGEVSRAARALAPPPPMLEPEQARFRVFQSVGALLKRVSEQKPLLLVLDDVHAADAASLHLLLAVARDLRRRRIVVLCTYRDVEAQLNDEVGEVLARVGREGTSLHLSRLGAEAVDVLVLASAGRSVSADVSRAIFDATNGNPLFVDEMVRFLAAQGRLDAVGEGPLPVPLGVREAIRQRLALARADVRAALETAAVVGREATVAMVAAVAGVAVNDALRDGARLGVLSRVDSGTVRFAHALYREELLRDMPEARRTALHLATARVLQATPTPLLVDVAAHLLDAGREHVQEAGVASLRAAESLLSALAFEDAAGLTRRALATPGLEARLQADLSIVLARAMMLAGDIKGAHALLLRVAELARERHDAELLGRAALGYGSRIVEGLVDPALIALLRESLELLASTSLLRPRVLARLASAQQPAADPWLPIGIAHEAIALARATGDDDTILATLYEGMGALFGFEQASRRVGVNEEVLRRAERAGDPTRQLRTHFRLSIDAVELGKMDRARQEVAAYEALGARLQANSAACRAPILRAMLAEADGNWADADRCLDEARRAGAQEHVVSLHAFVVALGRFDAAAAAEHAARAGHAVSDVNREAAEILDLQLAMVRHDRSAVQRWLGLYGDRVADDAYQSLQAASGIALVGDAVLARRVLAGAIKQMRGLNVETMTLTVEQPIETRMALLHLAAGDVDEARRQARVGLDLVGLRGFRGLFPGVALVAARVHRDGGPEVRAEARQWLKEARALLDPAYQSGLMALIDDEAHRLST